MTIQATLTNAQTTIDPDFPADERAFTADSSPNLRRGLTWRMIVLALCVAVLTYVTTSAIRRDFGQLRDSAERDLASSAQAVADRLDDNARRLVGLGETFSVSLQPLLQAGDDAGLKARLAAVERQFPGLSITRETGTIGDAEAGAVFRSPFERGTGNAPALSLALRLPAEPGRSQPPMLLQIGLRRDMLQRLLGERALSTGTIATLADQSRHIVARSRDLDSFAGRDIDPALSAALASAGNGVVHLHPRNGAPVTVAFAAAPLSGFAALVATDTDSLATLELRAMTRALVASLIISALGTAVVVLWTRRAVPPQAAAVTGFETTPDTATALARDLQAGRLAQEPAIQAGLREQAGLLLRLLDTLPALVILSRADGTASFLNRRARLTFDGLPFERADDRDRAVHPDDLPKLAGWRQILRAGVGTATVELRCRTDGAYRWHQLQAELLPVTPGQPPETLIIGIDIDTLVQAREAAAMARRMQELRLEERQRGLDEATLRLADERAQRVRLQAELMHGLALQGLGRLCASVAHTLHDALATIGTGYEIIRNRSADRVIRETMAGGQAALTQAARLVGQLRTAALPQSDPNRIADVADILTLFTPLAQAVLGEAVRLDLTLADGLWQARVDGALLMAALLQLATDLQGPDLRDPDLRDPDLRDPDFQEPGAGSAQLHIEAFNLSADLPPDFTDRVGITLGCSAPRLAAAPGQGEGMGIAMIGWLAAQSGGALTVDTPPGQGRLITLILPRASERSIARRGHAQDSDQTRRLTVLLVDDNHEVRRSAGLLMRTMGFRVETAANLADALALAQTTALDLVITDVVMPGGNGPVLVDQLRKQQPGIHVIYMTGHASTELADQGQRVLHKPFSLRELTDMVGELVGTAR